jgi:GH25 family lysozyme M1 (1,4-beta-N-acetylmuramidase)
MITLGGVVYPAGLDCSVYNGNITSALTGCEFAFARASIGTSTDASYPAHLSQMRAKGVVRGAYHFLTYGPGGSRQAGTFLNAVKDAELLALDMEGAVLAYPQVGRSFIVALRKLDPLKRPILLYSSSGTWPGSLGQVGNWVANYAVFPPPMAWVFAQYRGAPLDRDVYHGSVEALRAFAGRQA